MIESLVTTTERLLEYDDNSYWAIDYTAALQTLDDSINRLADVQTALIVLLSCVIALLLVLLFAIAFKHRNY